MFWDNLSKVLGWFFHLAFISTCWHVEPELLLPMFLFYTAPPWLSEIVALKPEIGYVGIYAEERQASKSRSQKHNLALKIWVNSEVYPNVSWLTFELGQYEIAAVSERYFPCALQLSNVFWQVNAGKYLHGQSRVKTKMLDATLISTRLHCRAGPLPKWSLWRKYRSLNHAH